MSTHTDSAAESDSNGTGIGALEDCFVGFDAHIEHVHDQEPRDGETVSADSILEPELAEELPHDLWTHQAAALDHLDRGDNVTVATSTSSGKTLIYTLQTARNQIEDPESTALILYPTKALSRDQQSALSDRLNEELGLDLSIGVYDGDTDAGTKRSIREDADLVITNFAGLNRYLGHHEKWTRFLSNCELVVIDEAHYYTGITGMHTAWIVRRLKRLLDYYGSDPQYILTSATIGNPAEHAAALIGERTAIIDEDGSPRGAREIAFWNPHGETQSGRTNAAASQILGALAGQDIQTLMFTRSRKGTELSSLHSEDFLADPDLPGNPESTSIEAYHAGYDRETRREIERDLRNGSLDGLISTNALELGIDIGSVEATVLSGYPGTRQSFWQQLGRSGRSAGRALTVLVGDYDSVDQYIMHNPEYILEDDIEDAVVNLSNNPIYSRHVLCAANELPLTDDDREELGGTRLEKAVDMWRRSGQLRGTLDRGVHYGQRDRPQTDVDLYASGGESFEIRPHPDTSLDDISLEPVNRERAYREFHPGAIFLHRGQQYRVEEFNEHARTPHILVRPVDVDYYSQSKSTISISDLDSRKHRTIGDFDVHWGTGTVTIHYDRFDKRYLGNGKPVELDIETGLDPIDMTTQMCWVEVPQPVEQAVVEKHGDGRGDPLAGYLGGLHALQHSILSVAPLELMMDENELDGIATSGHDEFQTSGFVIHDTVEGGVGFSRAVYDNLEALVSRAHDLLDTCTCGEVTGCPACAMDENCGNDNKPLHTPAAMTLAGLIHPETPDPVGVSQTDPSIGINRQFHQFS